MGADISIEVIESKSFNLVSYGDTKHARAYVVDGDLLHMSWNIGGGKILSVEYIPENWPAGSYVIYDTPKEYQEAIADIDWIQSNLGDDHEDYNPDWNLVDQEEDAHEEPPAPLAQLLPF